MFENVAKRIAKEYIATNAIVRRSRDEVAFREVVENVSKTAKSFWASTKGREEDFIFDGQYEAFENLVRAKR